MTLHTNRDRHRLQCAVVAFAVAGAMACDNEGPVAEVSARPQISRVVVGDAAARLDADGKFILGGPLDLPYPQISAQRAVELAKAYQKDGLGYSVHWLEQTRRGGIAIPSLVVCGRTYYAEPAVEPLPSDASLPVRRSFGPHWLVNFCGRSGTPEVALSISAHATDLSIQGGKIVYPAFNAGEWFRPIGIPTTQKSGLPGPPEDAAADVAELTHSMVTAVPRLVTIPSRGPEVSTWVIELEKPIAARGRISNERALMKRIYFADDMRWGHKGLWGSRIGGPTQYEYKYPISSGRPNVPPKWVTGRVSARPGFSIELEPVEEIIQ